MVLLLHMALMTTQHPYTLAFEYFTASGTLSIERLTIKEDIARNLSHEQLRFTSGKFTTPVRSAKDLVGRVKIRSTKGALEYVRLFTSTYTFNLFIKGGNVYLEPSTRSQASLTCYGLDANLIERLSSLPMANALGNSSDLEKLEILPPSVKAASRGFAVERHLVMYSLSSSVFVPTKLMRVRETVSQVGAIERIVLHSRDINERWPLWSLETYRM